MRATVGSSILQHIPSATDEPEDAPPTAMLGRSETEFSRRRLLSTIAGIGIAAGLGLLDALPWSRPQGAFAAAYQEWSTCQGYYASSTTCVPTTALYSNTCSGSWHRNDGSSGTCYNYRYYHHPTRCNGRNAWRWKNSRGSDRKCSDGDYNYADCGGGRVSRMSICRTAI